MDLINALIWRQFIEQAQLTEAQAGLFISYLKLLIDWNARINLTAINDPQAILYDHFLDSLSATIIIDHKPDCRLADVGSGAGFPGMPLLIKYPQLSVIFIEVISKKRLFLQTVISELGFEKRAQVSALDWRTFIRQETAPVDLFVSRASLRPDELIRAFGATSHYQQSSILYWASEQWQPGPREEKYLIKQFLYTIKQKQRKLLLFSGNKRG